MLIEEKKNTRKAILFILGSVAIILVLAFYGVPVITKITSFIMDFRKPISVSGDINAAPPAPPTFDNLPEAINKTPLEIFGSVVPGNTVMINFNGGESEIATKDNGSFSLKLDLVKGSNSIFAFAKGPTGILSQKSVVYTIVFDNESPKIEIASPKDGVKFYGPKQQTVTITGTTESGSTLTINDRIVPVADDDSFTYPYQLNNGENNLTLKSVDKAGNETNSTLRLYFYP